MYTLRWKNPALEIDGEVNANKELVINVPPGSVVDNRASIKFTGKGAGNYGQIQQENLMRMLEHFADDVENPPPHPTIGQVWYDTTNSQLKLCVYTSPAVWRVVAGFIVTNMGEPSPLGQLGDIWFERTGPLTGYLYVYTGTGRYPIGNGTALGGWNQIWPDIDMAGGREEYDVMADYVEQLIGSLEVGGNGAITRSIQNLSSLQQLDVALQTKYQATPDINFSPFPGDLSLLKVDPISGDWDTLLAAAKYAINRLDIPNSYKQQLSKFPFVQDGRQAPESLFELNENDPRYPDPLRRVLRKMGYATMVRLYSSTLNTLEKGLIDRYSVLGINGGQFKPSVTKTQHVIFGGSQSTRGMQSNLRMAFKFASKDARDRYLFSGGAVQITLKHSKSQLGTVDQVLSSYLESFGNFRITADAVRVFNKTFDTSSMGLTSNRPLVEGGTPPPWKPTGLSHATAAGDILYTATSETGIVLKITAFKISETRIDIDISLKLPEPVNGSTTFKYEIIEDTEQYELNGAGVRIWPGLLSYASGDASGSSWYVLISDDIPQDVNVPAGTLLYTQCAGTTMNGIYANGNGGTYINELKQNSPQCAGTACASTLYGVGTITIPAKTTAITLLGKKGITEPTIATADGQTKTFTSAASTSSTITFANPVTAKTLTFTIPTGGELSMTYCDFVPPPAPADGTLLRQECRGTTLWGIYANGTGGERDAIIASNSTQCGYVGSNPAAQLDIGTVIPKAVFGGAPTNNVEHGEEFYISVKNISGFTPGQNFTVSAVTTGAAARTEVLGTFTAGSDGKAPTQIKTYANTGYWAVGTYSVTGIIKNAAGATVLTLGTGEFTIKGNSAIMPQVEFTINNQTTNQTANVGAEVTSRITASKFKPFSQIQFMLDISGADNRTSGPFNYDTDAVGYVSTSFASTLLANDQLSGDVTYRYRAIGLDAAGTSKTATSNAITVTWKKQAELPTASLLLNGTAASPQNAIVEAQQHYTLTAAKFAPNTPLTLYLEITGNDPRTTGPFAHTSNSQGGLVISESSTLLANNTIRGAVTYKWRIVGNDVSGTSKTVVSNAITLNWSAPSVPPTAALFVNNSQSNQTVTVDTSVPYKFVATNFAANTPIVYFLQIRGRDNRDTGPFNYTTNSAGNHDHSSSSTLVAADLSGAVSYQLRVTGNDKNGASKTVLSNMVTLNWLSPTPVFTYRANNATYLSVRNTDKFTNTLTGNNWKTNSTITLYLTLSGADNRTVGPFPPHYADGNGNHNHSFHDGLTGVVGKVYAFWTAQGYKRDGSYVSVNSNTVTFDFSPGFVLGSGLGGGGGGGSVGG